jgi:hypothetical protein
MPNRGDKRRSRRGVDEAQPPRPYRVLLPLINLAEAEVLLPLAEAFVREWRGQLVILHVVTVPEEHSLSEAAAEVSRSRHELSRFLIEHNHVPAQVKTVVRVAREVWEGIWETVEQEGIDLFVPGMAQ